MALTDALDREVLQYVRYLLEHERQCASPACPVCSTLNNICDYTEGLLFSVNFYRPANSAEAKATSSTAAI